MRLKHTAVFILPVLMLLVVIHACKKESTPTGSNPYSNINRNDTSANGIAVDTLSITYVHQKVLSTRCALNGCHDGHFEPDYRTPQSAYATLVYAPIIKNDTAHRYKFRVIPFDTTNSVMYQRITNCCFVNVNDRMPQDNIGGVLPDSCIKIVRNWISHGAKDMFGNIATRPDEPPTVEYFFGISNDYQTVYSNNRLDSLYYNPFTLPSSVTSFIIAVADTDDITPTSQFKVNTLKLSTKATDFSSATSIVATYLNSSGTQYWLASVNPTIFPVGDTIYMRYYVNDGTHTANTEMPNNNLPSVYYTYWSFVRQ